jgi:Ca2+-binding RTX toxin-like protein
MFGRMNHSASQSHVAFQSLEQRRLMAADLVVESINVTSGLHTSTSELTEATIVVKNIGDSTAPAGARLRMRLSGDTQWGNADDLILNYKTIPNALTPGQTYTYSTAQRASAQPTGAFCFLAYVDGFNDVAESNENNNVLASDAGSVVYANRVWIGTDILGTDANDLIMLNASDDNAFITVNGETGYKPLAGVTQFFIDAGAGNDVIYTAPTFPTRIAATGSTGNDRIFGGAGSDELSGGVGMDKVYGGAGHDFLLGGAQNDRLYGDAGDDLLIGGGSNDYLFGGDGTNWLIGGNGNDRLFSKGNIGGIDTVSGNAGTDVAESDPTDLVTNVETQV